MSSTLKGSLLVAVGAAVVMAMMPPATSPATHEQHSPATVTNAAFSTEGDPVTITATDRKQGVTEGVAFSNALGTVTVRSDARHRARKVTVTTQYKGLTVRLKSRSGSNYLCSARQQTCVPDRPYSWSYLEFADALGTRTTRLNPGISASVPSVTQYKGKRSFVYGGVHTTARLVLTGDNLVTSVKNFEPAAGYLKFFLKDGTTATCRTDRNCTFEKPLNWYKMEEISTATGSPVFVGDGVWRADLQGKAQQAQED